MPGTIVFQEAVPYAELMNPLKRGRGQGLPTPSQLPRFRVKVDGKVCSDSQGLPAQVKVDAGTHNVQVVVGGYRTNTLAVEVHEGGRHVVQVTPTALRRLKYATGGAGLLAVIRPGMYWRVELPKA